MQPPIDLSLLDSAQKDELIRQLFEQIGVLQARIQSLEARLNINSRDSSKPPSSDGPTNKPKPKSRRSKSDKPSGGQPGHKGKTLERTATPDHVSEHTVDQCTRCGSDLSACPTQGFEARQVFDLPPIKVEVTEHRAHIKTCPCCQGRNKAAFPAGVSQPVQYGPQVQSVVTYLNGYQMLPYQRLKEAMQDLFGLDLSQGTVNNIQRRAHQQLQEFEEQVKAGVAASRVVHFDESGLRVGQERCWLHVASTPSLTYYLHHARRGTVAMKSMGILEDFDGYAVHDFYPSYFSFAILHVMCGAHIVRELIHAHEQFGQGWAEKLIRCLLEAKQEVDAAVALGARTLEPERIDHYEQRYRRILRKGRDELPTVPIPTQTKPGRPAQHKVKNLHDRLTEYQPEVLAYVYDLTLPFDNNLAERDVRVIKVKQKVSGCFRSVEGADMFCRIRSYISTARKQGRNILGALRDSFQGQAFHPTQA